MLTPREVQLLLERLCVELGFCLDPDVRAKLMENPPSNAAAFTDAVFIAEGLDPTTASRHLYRQVKAVVTEAFRNGGVEQFSDDMNQSANPSLVDLVAIVLTDDFSGQLSVLSQRACVWMVDTPQNRAAISAARTQGRDLTTFESRTDWSSGAEQVSLLDTVFEHHRQCTHLELFGVSVTRELLDRLAFFGFRPESSTETETTPSSFVRDRSYRR